MANAPKVEWEHGEVVARLTKYLQQGCSFEFAWNAMMREVRAPQPLRRAGQRKDENGAQLVLVGDDGDPDELGIVDAMRGYCEDAYFGRKPRLAGFNLRMLYGSDQSGPAHRVGEIRVAA